MTLQEALKQKSSTASTNSGVTSKLTKKPELGQPSNIMVSKLGGDAAYLPKNVDEARKLQKENPTLWQRISKELMKPVGLAATMSETGGNVLADVAYGDYKSAGMQVLKTPGKLGGILTGTKTNSYSDIWNKAAKNGIISERAAFWGGLANDLASDPLNFVGGGLTKAGTVINKVERLRKTGETVKVGSKIHKELVALGLWDDLDNLALAKTKAEQAQLGQRAFLSLFANSALETKLVKGAKIYEKLDILGTGIKQTRAAQIISKVFSTKTSNEAFNEVKNHFTNLMDYNKGEVMVEAKKIQTMVGNLSTSESKTISDLIEKAGGKTIEVTDDISAVASRIQDNFKTIIEKEKSLGLVKTNISDYFPHIKAVEKTTKTPLQKIKELFQKADGTIDEKKLEGFGDSKTYSTKLDSSKERKILRFVGKDGKEVGIGMPEVLGLRKINSEKLISRLSEQASSQIGKLQNLQVKLAAPEIGFGTEDLMETIKDLRKHVSSVSDIIDEDVTKVDLGEYQSVVKGLVDEAREKLSLKIKDLEAKVKTTQGVEFSKGSIGFKASREQKIVDIQKDITKITNDLTDQMRQYEFFDFADKEGNLVKSLKGSEEFAGYGQATVNEINEAFGTDFFESRPAIAFAQRALASAKAVASKEFFESSKQFGAKVDDMSKGFENFVEVGIKELEGYKFAPDVADQLTSYQKSINPEELKQFIRTFDSIQNWWKAQALLGPSYHIRNLAGNMWNNYLAGVYQPRSYFDAGKLQTGKIVKFTDEAGREWNNDLLMKAAKQSGVIDQGWYAKDIEMSLASEMGGISTNPMKQNFALFKGNRALGSVFENNARLAHFIEKIKSGSTVDDAATSVKKFLFDYGDLTDTEKVLMKRLIPFYTWTRKNIPLQVERLFKQPGKIATVPKIKESIEGQVDKPNEKYLGDYIRDNIGMRVGTDEQGNTMYFLLGNWLPAAQAVDFLSQPTENFIMSVSPFLKTPIELWANQSFFFKDTFGEPVDIERYPHENESFLGFTGRKKTVYILKNIRILNELDKINPGSIFGDKDNPSLMNKIAPEFGVNLGKFGTITTTEKRTGKFTPEGDQVSRILQSMFGKTSLYNPNYAKKFYLWDTETKVKELEKAIKDARRDGQDEYAKRLREELGTVKRSR